MKALYTLSENLSALSDLLQADVQGSNSIVECIPDGLPAEHHFWDWRAVPDWLTTATVTDANGDAVPRFRLRPGWDLRQFRGNDNRFPITWIETDAEGNITADATFAPGIFLSIHGPGDEFHILVDYILANSVADSWLGGEVTGREVNPASGWVRFFRPRDVEAFWAARGIPGHTTNRGETYEEEDVE